MSYDQLRKDNTPPGYQPNVIDHNTIKDSPMVYRTRVIIYPFYQKGK